MTDVKAVHVVFTESEPAYYERLEFGVICPACRERAEQMRVHSEGREPLRFEAVHVQQKRLCAGVLAGARP
jgi:hypothetical protein